MKGLIMCSSFFRAIVVIICFICTGYIFAQQGNCFLEDFTPKLADKPLFENAEKPTGQATVNITINPADTIGKISPYIFGTAVAVWVGQNQNNPVLVDHLKKLGPDFIRFPGGSWSNVYFWNEDPGDLPTTVPDGTKPGQSKPLDAQLGPNRSLTLDEYYKMCDSVGTQGLITVNYGYARYGLGDKPAERAAHLAADWVRYDNGRTKFWEIGNENAGPWEAGWEIDTTVNKDGQPRIITGALYGKHFRIFADSMRAAAREVGAVIYIGGQVLHYDAENPNHWNVADRTWNQGFFAEVDNAADFYVMHNYYGSTATINSIFNVAQTQPKIDIDFIRHDIAAKGAADKPVAITEYNLGLEAGQEAHASFIKGMQSVILFGEMIKNNFGMTSRWLVANWEADGGFYNGNDGSIPQWNPRPEFFYITLMEQFTGDHSITASSDNANFLVYASTFSSGEAGFIVINKSPGERIVRIHPGSHGVGEKYYIYTLNGGSDGQLSKFVTVNDEAPSPPEWGPLVSFGNIPAYAYPVGNEIKFVSPARSVQYIMTDAGSRILTSVGSPEEELPSGFFLGQNYPNPFNPVTKINYALPIESAVTIKIYNQLGEEVKTIINENQQAGNYTVSVDAASLATGMYIYKMQAGSVSMTKKLMLLK